MCINKIGQQMNTKKVEEFSTSKLLLGTTYLLVLQTRKIFYSHTITTFMLNSVIFILKFIIDDKYLDNNKIGNYGSNLLAKFKNWY